MKLAGEHDRPMRKRLKSNGIVSTDLVVALVLLVLVMAMVIVGLELRRHIQ